MLLYAQARGGLQSKRRNAAGIRDLGGIRPVGYGPPQGYQPPVDCLLLYSHVCPLPHNTEENIQAEQGRWLGSPIFRPSQKCCVGTDQKSKVKAERRSG